MDTKLIFHILKSKCSGPSRFDPKPNQLQVKFSEMSWGDCSCDFFDRPLGRSSWACSLPSCLSLWHCLHLGASTATSSPPPGLSLQWMALLFGTHLLHLCHLVSNGSNYTGSLVVVKDFPLGLGLDFPLF